MSRFYFRYFLLFVPAFALGAGCVPANQSEPRRIARPAASPMPSVWLPIEIDDGADVAKQAAAALRRHDFRLIADQSTVLCFTPGNRLPESQADSSRFADMITPRMARLRSFANVYNRLIIESEYYPYKDICRLRSAPDVKYVGCGDPSRAARQVSDPVRSLHEAVRRGSLDDVYRFLRTTPIGQLDGAGMTAAGWAAARGREDVYDALVANGEPAWTSENYNTSSAAFWAAATGRSQIFKKTLSAADAPMAIPALILETALSAKSLPVIELILSHPHNPMRNWTADVLDAPLEVVERVLADDVTTPARELLSLATHSASDAFRPDLIRLALQNHANPDGFPAIAGEYDPPLVSASRCYLKNSREAVLALVGAGANVNVRSTDARAFTPIDGAMQSLANVQFDQPSRPEAQKFQERAVQECHQVIDLLIRNGATLNDVDKLGRRGAWRLFGGPAFDPYDFKTSGAATLRFLVSRGLDVNAHWRGQTLLQAIEQRRGHDKVFAASLRAVGAK